MNLDDDDFTLFGLPRRMAVDRALLDQRWKQLQAEVHPDRFAAEGKAAQRVAMQWSVRVNEAYRRLKDPLARAGQLCELAGAPVAAHDNTAMPAAFLMQQMAWREELDDASGAESVRRLDERVRAEQQQMLARLQAQLDDAGDAAAAAQTLRGLMFVERFREDLDRRLDALEP